MKTQTLIEVAKFCCGVTAWESFVHASLWSSDVTSVIFGITLTDTLNQIHTFIPTLILIILAYYAWFKK